MKMTKTQWKFVHTEGPADNPVGFGECTLVIGDITQDEALMVQADLLAYINKGRPSAQRTDLRPTEPLSAPLRSVPAVKDSGPTAHAEGVGAVGQGTGAPPAGGDSGGTSEKEEEEEKADPEDLSVFGRLTKLQDIVKELQRRGAKSLDEVLVRCKELKDAEVAPVLSRIADFETRVRTCCAALQIPGAV